MLRVGIDFGGTKIAYGLYDESMRLLMRHKVKTDAGASPQIHVGAMAHDVEWMLAQAGYSMEQLGGVGIGFPSHISYEEGRVLIATNLPQWEDVPLRDMMESQLSIPVWVDNDTNCATLAEHRLGAGKGIQHMTYMTVSTGIGCGFIINGQMYRGAHGFAGELGQIFISDAHGYETERMNAGVVQSIASGPMLARLARDRILSGEGSAILAHAGAADLIACEHIGLALAQGDALAEEIIAHAAKYLGRMLTSLFELMDIGMVVYGGGVFKVSPRLAELMIQTFFRLSHGARKCPIEIVPAALGDDAGLIGAALMVAL